MPDDKPVDLFSTEDSVFENTHRLAEEIPLQLVRYEEAVRDLRDAQKVIDQFEAKARYLVATVRDPDTGKPVFSNDASREYAFHCIVRQGGGEDLIVPLGVSKLFAERFDVVGYEAALSVLNEAEEKKWKEQAELERLRRSFSVSLLDYRATLELRFHLEGPKTGEP